jgi:hypothetical protein
VNAVGEDGNKDGGGKGHLDGGGGGEGGDEGETLLLLLPLARLLDAVGDEGEDDLGGPRVHVLDSRLEGSLASLSDGLLLVGDTGEESGKKAVGRSVDNVGLEVLNGAVLDEGRDGGGSTLTGGGVLLVAEGLRRC